MLFPKKVKHRKWQTKRIKTEGKMESRGSQLAFGSYGIKATSAARITSNQIEAARRAMVRKLGKTAKVWIRIFPDRPFTKKPAQVKMGKGKGNPEGFQAETFPGRIIFEVDNIDEATAREALRKAGTKLPVTTRIVAR